MVKRFVFVSSWWQHSENLASYEQQDAHEFFISMLDAIHEKDGKTRNGGRGMLRFGIFLHFCCLVCTTKLSVL